MLRNFLFINQLHILRNRVSNETSCEICKCPANQNESICKIHFIVYASARLIKMAGGSDHNNEEYNEE